MTDRDKSIRDRAYEIWESEGRPEGREADHWQQAAAELSEIRNESASGDLATGKKTKPAAKSSSTKPKAATDKAAPATSGSRSKGKDPAKTGEAAAIDRDVAVLGEKPAAVRKGKSS